MRPGIQMRDRLLLDEWEPHVEAEYPGDEETLRFAFFRLFDQCYDLLTEDGMDPDEAQTTVRVLLGSST